MIGIYKITNKLNGKSYIGQSIHCNQRIEEHCRGKKQFIDETIQLEGKENFTFELLEECEKDQLNEREDYYIAKYNTMFPSGYNKRWNNNQKTNKNNYEEEIPDYIEKECEAYQKCFWHDINKTSKIQVEYLNECHKCKSKEEYKQINYKYIEIFTQLLKDLKS